MSAQTRPRRTTVAVLVAVAALVLTACGTSEQRTVTFDLPYPEHGADGAPILAAFHGRIPCDAAGCSVRKVSLVLYQHEKTRARTYWLGVVPVNGGNDRIVTEGAWRARRGVEGYPHALAYELEASTQPGLKSFWRVSDDILIPLNEHRAPKAGDGAWGNMLSRDTEPYGPRTYRIP
jgi:hypothetical protein